MKPTLAAGICIIIYLFIYTSKYKGYIEEHKNLTNQEKDLVGSVAKRFSALLSFALFLILISL